MSIDLYVLQHTEIQIDGFRIFKDLDTALSSLKEWYELLDDDLSAFSLSVFKYDEEQNEFVFSNPVDLTEYFSESEEDEDSEEETSEDEEKDDDVQSSSEEEDSDTTTDDK